MFKNKVTSYKTTIKILKCAVSAVVRNTVETMYLKSNGEEKPKMSEKKIIIKRRRRI